MYCHIVFLLHSSKLGTKVFRVLIRGTIKTVINDSLCAGRFGDGIPVGATFSAPVQTRSGAHPTYYTMGNGSLSRSYNGLGVALITHPPQI